jgi:hypothetical protein
VQPGIRELGPVDCGEVRRRILAWPEEIWWQDQLRQTQFRNVHAETQSVILIFCEGWPDPVISYRAGWGEIGAAAERMMQEIISAHYPPGGGVLRAMLARLPPGARIARHRDTDPSFAVSHRIHVPVITNPGVSFIVGSQTMPAIEGTAFELNNLLPHEVVNRGESHRIHFIFDYLPMADEH